MKPTKKMPFPQMFAQPIDFASLIAEGAISPVRELCMSAHIRPPSQNYHALPWIGVITR